MARLVVSHLVLANVLVFLLLTGPSLQCGPGRGAGRRRKPRKMTPLVFKQHVPNVSENTLGASGQAEGKIERTDPKFSDLLENQNPDILFKDEEGTGADRIMTQRCKDKLNTLAISVMNQWQGVKLRVTEAWDDEGHHTKDSLHYEGRAVDITTSDRDKTKYGMLARLAVEAGFDWVYYESRSHIHCSVKSDSSIEVKNGGCFPSRGLVQLHTGEVIPVSDVTVGDRVLATDEQGQLVYSEVYMFLHRDNGTREDYVVIETDNLKSLSLTPTHLIHVTDTPAEDIQSVRPKFARNVQEGQYVYVVSVQGVIEASKVLRISSRTSEGVYAPLTSTGTIVVDGVVTSCYAVIEDEDIAHTVFAPLRWFHYATGSLGLAEAQNQSPNGVHWYADILYSIGHYVVPSDLWHS